jgi:carbonic anhydrase
MQGYRRLLEFNERWVHDRVAERPDYFERLKDDQNPEYVWIGCSDSRVPAETVTGCAPGDLFVHRNVANMVVHTDLNLLTVLHYALDHLKVKHIIVCGHYGCGGVRAAMSRKSLGLINKWLRNVKDVYQKHEAELEALQGDARFRRLVELNVNQQVEDLAKTSVVQRHWTRGERPWLHGWVYDVKTGRLKALTRMTRAEQRDDIHKYQFDDE